MSGTITGTIYQAPDGGSASLNGVTASGAVYGSQDGDGYIAAPDGTFTLVSLPGTTTTILGLNASGTVGYGEATSPGSFPTYFVDQGGSITLVPQGSTPLGVDSNGDILLTYNQLLTNGVVTPITTLGAGEVASAISPTGTVAGYVFSTHIVQWFVDVAGAISVHPYPDQAFGASNIDFTINAPPVAVNDVGDVALSGTEYPYTAVAAADGSYLFNGMLLGPVTALNAEGASVDYTPTSPASTYALAFVPGADEDFIEVAGLTDLEPLGINDADEIVGTGVNADGDVVGFTAELPCFVAGTLIAGADGEVRVERLRPGDLVRSADGTLRPVL